MKRKIYQQLLDWKEKRKGEVALLIEGARRIGKSYIVEKFGQNEYESYLLIDFNKAPQMVRNWFDFYLEDLDTLFLYLSQHYKVRLHERKSLIILDEVQLCPRARAAIKFLVADGRYDYIETGSLVSIKKERMGIDFLLQKDNVTIRHNIRPIEVKSGKNYRLSSLKKCIKKFAENTVSPTVLHAADYREEDGITYLPLYMTPLL